MDKERRAARRAAWTGSALFDLNSHAIHCKGVNVSEGGIGFSGPWLAKQGQRVAMKLQLFDRQVRALGRVAWVRREGGQTIGGIAFEEVPPNGQEILRSYVTGMSVA